MGQVDQYPEYPSQNPNSPVMLAYTSQTTAASVIGTTETDLTGMSVSVFIPEGRRIRISAYSLIQKQTSTGWTWTRIVEGSTYVGSWLEHIATDEYATACPSVILTPTAGLHTYRLRGQTAGNNATWLTHADYPQYIMVEDVTGMPLAVAPASQPVGQLAYAQVVANQSGITTETDITSLSANITVPAGRTIKITGQAGWFSTVANDVGTLAIKEGATQLNRDVQRGDIASGGQTLRTHAIVSPTAGAHTYKLTLTRAVGTGSLSVEAGATLPAFILVEDITATPAQGTGAPSSTLAYAEVTANQGSITTEVDLTNLSVNVTVPAGRRLRVSGSAYYTNTGTTGYDILKVYQDGVQVTERGQAADTDAHTVACDVILSPSAGLHTYKLRGQATAGTATFNAAATYPGFILVEDITAALWSGGTWSAGAIASEPWPTFSPVLTQSGSVTKTDTYVRYTRVGRTITYQAFMTVTGAGTASNAVTFTLPTPAASTSVLALPGQAYIFDASVNTFYPGTPILASTTQIGIIPGVPSVGVGSQYLGLSTFTAALASGDLVSVSVIYEAAS